MHDKHMYMQDQSLHHCVTQCGTLQHYKSNPWALKFLVDPVVD